MQSVEGPNPESGRVADRELRADFEGPVGQRRFHPKVLRAMLLKLLQQAIGLAARDCLPEHMLLEGVSPLRYMQGSHPQRWLSAEPLFSLCGVLIGEIE